MITDISIVLQGQTYVITCTFDQTLASSAPSRQTITVTREALAALRSFSGSATDEEALQWVIHTHYARLNGASQAPPPSSSTWEDLSIDQRRQALGIAGLPSLALPHVSPQGDAP